MADRSLPSVVTQILNEARCLSDRPVGNVELARRICRAIADEVVPVRERPSNSYGKSLERVQLEQALWRQHMAIRQRLLAAADEAEGKA